VTVSERLRKFIDDSVYPASKPETVRVSKAESEHTTVDQGDEGEKLDADRLFCLEERIEQFDEVMVSGVHATPQRSHVVLKDIDGDGIYTGSLAAGHYFPWAPEPDGSWAIHYFDRIDYEITFDSDGTVADFSYLQYEHKKL